MAAKVRNRVETRVNSFPRRNLWQDRPFLAPLAEGRFRRLIRRFDSLPPAVAPAMVTLVGGVVLVAVLAGWPGGDAGVAPPQTAPAVEQEQAAASAPEAPAEPVPLPMPEPEPRQAAIEAGPPETVAGTEADLPAASPDPARTASILPARPGAGSLLPPVAVAETEEEIAALEEIQRREVEADVGPPSGEWVSAAQPVAQPAATMRPAVATRYVNMRAGPDDDAEILAVVPALAEIEAEQDCNWCAVTYQGRSGYVYRSFISYE